MRTISIALVAVFLGGCSSATSTSWGGGDAGTSSGGSGSSSGGGSGSGSGSSSGGGSGSSSGSSSGGGSGSSSGSSSGGGSGSSSGSSSGGGSGSSSGGNGACTYPAGPYGLSVGSTMDPTLSWPGYAAGSTTQTTIHTTDLFDCDKSKGINAIVLDISATWCQPCQQEAQEFDPQFAKSWLAEGVVVLTLMYQDGNNNPATAQTALDWINQFSLKHVAVVAAPTFDFVPSTGAIPTLALVDPRTMKIESVTLNDLVGDPSVDQLAQKNK